MIISSSSRQARWMAAAAGIVAVTALTGTQPARADGIVVCNDGSGTATTECGTNATTGSTNYSTAIGAGIAGNTGDGEIVAQAGFAFGF